MRFHPRLFVLAAWTAFIAALSACAAKQVATYTGEVKNPETYTYLTISDMDTFDPAWAYDTASHENILQIYEPLLAFKGSSLTEFEPLISTEVPSVKNGLLSKDGRTYRFPIRKGVRFHDGSPMTAADVKYSIMRFCLEDRDGGPAAIVLEPLTGYPSTRRDGKPDPAVYKAVEDALAIEGDDLVVTLKRPFAPFLSILAQWSPVLPRKYAGEHGDWDGRRETWMQHNNPKKEDSAFYAHPIGTGPFKLERWAQATKEVVLVRNDDYWRAPAKLKRVIVKGVDEFATRKLMLAAGDADAIYADRNVWSDIQGLPGVQIMDDLPTVEMNPALFFTLDIDTTANPDVGSAALDGNGIPHDFFQDIDIRKGFLYAFDYQGFIRDVDRGKGTQAHGCIPKGLIGYDESLPVYSFDLKRAEDHFRKAWGGKVWDKGFRFTATFNEGNQPRQVMMQIVKRTVEGINPKFRIDLRGVQWSTYLTTFNAHKLPFFAMGWEADYPDPHNFAFNFLHSKGNWPFVQRFSDPRLDKLVEQAKEEIDPAKRQRLYVEMQKLAHDLAIQMYVVDRVRYRTQRDWVQGWVHNPVFPDAPWACYLYPVYKAKSPAGGAAR